ncbi:MAG: iron ABC transporter permease, partial [Pseudomonadota bacterium]
AVPSAWLVTRYEFPFRKVFEWALLLPLAMPAYLIAYSYTDFLEFGGPVQNWLRQMVCSSGQPCTFRLPEIRSMGGGILMMGAVLYPYIYMLMRAALLLTPDSVYEAAMLARRNPFFHIALPITRPAIIAGLALVVMEVIADFGTVEYFAIETMTLGILNVWLGMNNLPAAAQIACSVVVVTIMLIALEKRARGMRRYFVPGTRQSRKLTCTRSQAAICITVCLIPVTIGFIIPVLVLLSLATASADLITDVAWLGAGFNSVLVAGLVVLAVMGLALFMVLVANWLGKGWLQRLTWLASCGYAFPGILLAIGVVGLAGVIDQWISQIALWFSLPFKGLLSGSLALVIIACTVRFQAIGHVTIASGLERIPANLLPASRTLGYSFWQSFKKVIFPLMRPAILAGSVLVFVDVMKELPMTLLLRPFNFETLATYVYQFAKDELLEEAAIPALLIVLAGIIPVFVIHASLGRQRPGLYRH